MRREFSAGGVLVRRLKGRWMVAAIRPAGRPEGLWALPKGNIGPGEEPAAAAVREVAEETGARGKLDRKLTIRIVDAVMEGCRPRPKASSSPATNRRRRAAT